MVVAIMGKIKRMKLDTALKQFRWTILIPFFNPV